MVFQPEHAEDISCVYLLNQIFESVSDLLAKEISKEIHFFFVDNSLFLKKMNHLSNSNFASSISMIIDRLRRVGPRGRARGRKILGVHPLSWLLSNNRLEKVPFVRVPHTSSN